MPRITSQQEYERTARQLRLRIGRLRRRIDGRLRATSNEAARLVSWKTYVSRYSNSGMALAFGVGLSLAAGFSGPRLLRWIGRRAMREGLKGVGAGVINELRGVWNESSSTPPARKEGCRD